MECHNNILSPTQSFLFSQNKMKQRVLPDIVATTKHLPQENSSAENQKQNRRISSETEDTEERLKAIFQLHSMKLSEQTKTRRNSDPDPGCKRLTTTTDCYQASCDDPTKRSSMSSDSSSNTKYEDVKHKVKIFGSHRDDDSFGHLLHRLLHSLCLCCASMHRDAQICYSFDTQSNNGIFTNILFFLF